MSVLSREAVVAALHRLDLNSTELQIDQWLAHLDLLLRWNKAYNLTAITEPNEVITQHLLDSLSIQESVTGPLVYDIGTGGGFPGIPLAILFPQFEFVLVDTVQKKTRFLRQVVSQLGLTNVSVIHARVETLKPGDSANQIVSRAFSSIKDFLNLTQNLSSTETEWLAMKGKLPTGELEALQDEFTYTVNSLNVPGLNADRHLIRLQKTL